jgi:hypothetical protein
VWLKGSNIAGSFISIKGSEGVADSTYTPGARKDSAVSIDNSDNVWLFGGFSTASLQEFWKFNGTDWAWVSSGSGSGNYGVKGTPSPTNIPGKRSRTATWTDSLGNFWMFGGYANYSGSHHYYNDLWKFDGTNWTWVAGLNSSNGNGTWGTLGTPASANMPSPKDKSTSWVDSSDNLWLLGGKAKSDLWRFDGTNWTWMGGLISNNQISNNGNKRIPSITNKLGTTDNAKSWIDNDGKVWVFGGYGKNSSNAYSYSNSLWRIKTN